MKPAGLRTDLAFLRAQWSRRLMFAAMDVLDAVIRRCDRWADRLAVGLSWAGEPAPVEQPVAPPVKVEAVHWVGPYWAWYRDGRADVWVPELGPGSEPAMVDAYLRELHAPAPKGVRP